MKQPYFSSVPKSSGMSDIEAADAPDARLKVSPQAVTLSHAAANSSIALPVIPRAQFDARLLHAPDTENDRRPTRPLRPLLFHHSLRASIKSRTQNIVSTCVDHVGRPNRPTCVRERRLVPRQSALALDDSIIEDSSPQIYAPAPRLK